MEQNWLTLPIALLLQAIVILALVAAHSRYAVQLIDRATGRPSGELSPVWPLPVSLWRAGFSGFAWARGMRVRVDLSPDGEVNLRLRDPQTVGGAQIRYSHLRVGQSVPVTLDYDIRLLRVEELPGNRFGASTH